MSYVPTLWETGDTVTAEKLNKVETEVASLSTGEPLWVNVVLSETTENDGTVITATIDKEPGTIVDCITNNIPVFAKVVDGENVGAVPCSLINAARIEEGGNTINVVSFSVTIVDVNGKTDTVATFTNSRTTTELVNFVTPPET